MAEPSSIVAAIHHALDSDTTIVLPPAIASMQAAAAETRRLAGRSVVVTAGPTHEPLDPVRFIANRSSGKQGYAIAAAAAEAGASVLLVAGPVALADPPGVRTVHVETALQMLEAVKAELPTDIFVATAAVADWRPADVADQKLKKQPSAPATLTLVENPDILAMVARMRSGRPRLVAGFAAETQDLLRNARDKLDRKGCDIVIANDISAAGGAMGGDLNTVHVLTRTETMEWPTLAKSEVARRLVSFLASELEKTSP